MTNYVVGSGQVSSGITLDSLDSMQVFFGGKAVATTVNQAGTLFDDAGIDLDTNVTFSGVEEVYPAGVASDTVLSAGVQIVEGGAISTTVSSGSVQAVQSGIALDTVVSNGGTVAVTLNGLTMSTVVNSGGEEVVFPAGKASGTLVNSSGAQYLLSSGAAVGTVVRGGVEVVSGAFASGTVVSSGGSQAVVLGGVADGTVVSTHGGQAVGSESIASGTVLAALDATELVANGGVAIDTTVSSGGVQGVTSGGIASNTTIRDGGVEYLSSGGSAVSTSLAAGGLIDLANFPYVTGASASLNSSDMLTISAGGSSTTLQLAGDYTGEQFRVTSDTSGGTIVTDSTVPCFCGGTRFLTNYGEVAVEMLQIGNQVTTISGTLRSIIWIGHRLIDCRQHPEAVYPVRIMTGAFGNDFPHRDLYLSPDHSVFVDGVLIPIHYLLNGSTIAQVTIDEVTYYHVELATHGVILAEGLPCESYLDTGNRAAFDEGDTATVAAARFG
jgi:autotransporter passenger strand-loop-strand repeat protein